MYTGGQETEAAVRRSDQTIRRSRDLRTAPRVRRPRELPRSSDVKSAVSTTHRRYAKSRECVRPPDRRLCFLTARPPYFLFDRPTAALPPVDRWRPSRPSPAGARLQLEVDQRVTPLGKTRPWLHLDD